jgi:glyoxylase-like metal-dependent hydrolase (beta-lactamase superfamily II)
MTAIQRFDTISGLRIYRIPMVVFPNGFVAYSYLLLGGVAPTLIDTGSGFDQSNQDLMRGLDAVRDDFGESITPGDIAYILVTHGHLDHFGGVAFMLEQTGARIGVHELDRRVLTNYEERVVMATKDLRIYLERAGVDEPQRTQMMEMYGFAKKHIRSVPVDFDLKEDAVYPDMVVYHMPGHCPGQVVLKFGEVLLCADHILSRTTPHQAPESITHYTGLGHYLDSLRKMEKIDGIELALGGHEDPIYDVYDRVQAIRHSHERKLNRVLDIITENGPCTINAVTQTMYPGKTGYETILALEEAGAHIEYLYQHGMISVANLDEVQREDNPALCYALTTG